MGSCLSSDGGQGSPCSPSSTIDGRHRKRGSTPSDSKRHGELHKIPGRLFSNGASDCASLFTQQGKKGTNQDAMIVWENFGARSDAVFCGVFDGHGPFGHMVARKVRDSLPLKISAQWDANSECDDPRESSSSTMESMVVEKMGSVCIQSVTFDDLKEKEKYPEFFWALKESYLKAYKSMDRELKMHRKINCICSGTTAVTLVKQGQDLVVGNLGDSRAILATRDAANSLVAVQLTVDLKPNLPKEQERIRQCKGRVFSLQEEPDVARVWLPNNDSPGLAMARAFGDFCLKDFGLISVPEISYRHLIERDEFVVLATDGVWDVLSNKEVVDTIASAPSQSSAARFLVETAVKTWRYKFPTSKIDDCAVVCLFLNTDSSRSITSYIGKKERFESTNAKTCIEDQVLSGPVTLERSGTVRSSLEKPCTGEIGSPMKATKSRAHRRPSNGTAVTGKLAGTEWSALEGVSRANTLLTLPEFVSEQSPHTKMLI